MSLTSLPLTGAPLPRVDGPLKVSGRAPYVLDRARAGEALVGVFVLSAIGKGRIAAIYTGRAERAPGVHLVLTHRNVPDQGAPDPAEPVIYAHARPILASAEIAYFGEPVALVVAGTFEAARDAARLVEVTYEEEPGRYAFLPGRPGRGAREDAHRLARVDRYRGLRRCLRVRRG